MRELVVRMVRSPLMLVAGITYLVVETTVRKSSFFIASRAMIVMS